jgi:hypothetical protein
MRIHFKLLGRIVNFDFGFKETDMISSKEVKQNANVYEISPKLRAVHRKITIMSKRYNQTEFFVQDLSEDDIEILRRKGFRVTLRTRTLKGQIVVKLNHYRITV